MTKNNDDDPSMPPKVAAAFLGMSVKTLAHYRTKGNGPLFWKPTKNGRIYYLRSELVRWRDSRMMKSTSDRGMVMETMRCPKCRQSLARPLDQLGDCE